jgi:hypothetical protein
VYRNILSQDQLEARGKNAVADLLARRLIVPKIFFDAAWPTRKRRIDVLAVDRAGAGDIHVVEVMVGINAAMQSLTPLMLLPAHYKYVAIVNPGQFKLQEPILYSDDGLGRIGVILFEEEEHNQLVARIEIVPERFRVGAEVIQQIDRFTAKQHADIEIRV